RFYSSLFLLNLYVSNPCYSVLYLFFSKYTGPSLDLHSFPTRRSSDLFNEIRQIDYFDSPVAYDAQILLRRAEGLPRPAGSICARSEEHTAELQSRGQLGCRRAAGKNKIGRCTLYRVIAEKRAACCGAR